MNIRELRTLPTLPEEYFAVREALEASLVAQPLFAREANLAVFHAVAALERMIWQLRPVAARELVDRLAMRLPVEVAMYSMVIHGFGNGLTNLVREIRRRSAATLGALTFDPIVLSEAESGLRAANGIGELFIVFGDVEMGWRDCRVDGKTLRFPSSAHSPRTSLAMRR